MKDKENSTQGEEMIEKLIAAAGPGPTASPEARQRIYGAVRARWEAESQRRRNETRTETDGIDGSAGRHTGLWPTRAFAIAATVVALAVTLFWLQDGPDTNLGLELAQFIKLSGSTQLERGDETRALEIAEPAGTILAGDTLHTEGDGLIALEMQDGLLLRLNVSTEVRFVDQDEIELIAGTIYIDSGNGISSQPLEVNTPFGSLQHVGTQYEVHSDEASLRVRVREGRVAVRSSTGETIGVDGEQLLFDDAGLSSRVEIASDDPAWDWVISLATLPPADDYPLGATLTWAAREMGLTLEYASPAARRQINDQVVFGLEDLNPIETLDVLERTSDLRTEIRGTRLVVLN
jgi:ferric-dicitrate binding protein FerR (iron transport regulator)